MRKFFSTDKKYQEELLQYSKIDAVIAIGFYAFYMGVYYWMGRLYADQQIYLGVACNLLLAVGCLLLVMARRQKLSSVGLTVYKLKKAVSAGSVLGVAVIVFAHILPRVLAGTGLILNSRFLYQVFYYFVAIGFTEELIFRGYIQTRLYGLFQNDFAAIAVGAVMFSLMHIPFQMGMANMDFFEFLRNNVIWLLLLLGWHVVFNFLYRKYNSIFTGTIFHGFLNLGNSLFL